MRKFIPILFYFLIFVTGFSTSKAAHILENQCRFAPVNKVIKDIPADLTQQILLVPKYDLISTSAPRAQEVNRSVKEGNEEIERILRKNYKGKYKMVSLKEIENLKKQGSTYLLDMVVMPKQFKEPKREAMVSCYKKHRTANEMFSNYSAQFHYYFYIRNLQTDDGYISTDFKGKFMAYDALETFLDQVRKDTK